MENKPILVAREELAKNMADTINQSGVPLYVVEPLLEKILSEVRAAVSQQYQQEKAEYEKAQEEEVQDEQ